MKNQNSQGRREFVKNLSLSSLSLSSLSLLSISMFTGGCEDLFDKINNRPVRRMIRNNTAANQMMDIYKEAVAAMKSLPSTDGRNWTMQAQIHQNYCPHNNWFFYPWHRAYLFYFEDICKKLTGENNFGLPYWNWSIAPGGIPSQFWDTSSSLFNNTRIATSSSIPNQNVVGLTHLNNLCNETDFFLFAGSATAAPRGFSGSPGNVEAGPHNYIHTPFVIGDMGGYMSPLDAVFWNHHCMIDVCWYEWNVLRSNANTNDHNWGHFDYVGMFTNGNGNPVSITTLGTILMPLLSYRYETGIDGVDNTGIIATNKKAFENIQTILQKGAPISYDIKQKFIIDSIDKNLVIDNIKGKSVSIKTDTTSFERVIGTDKEERVLLKLNGIGEPDIKDFFIRIFINNPKADRNTSIEDPSYAGSFYFFTHGTVKLPKEQRNNYTVDITDTLRKLKNNGSISSRGNIDVNIVGISEQNLNTRQILEIDNIEILVSNVVVNKMKLE